MTDDRDYELVDCGDRRRLERFGERLVDRPAPAAIAPRRARADAWTAADLRFDRERGWTGADTKPWTVAMSGLTLELRPAAAGQVGLYPEHATFWPWLSAMVRARPAARVLNLFGGTGGTTLALAAAGAQVTHVDAARSAVAWARRNASLSGLDDRPIRWIVDDAVEFVRREIRRSRRYDGVILDPPSFGHGPNGRRWDLRQALPELLELVATVAEPEAFVLLTAHTAGLEPDDLRELAASVFDADRFRTSRTQLGATSGATLQAGVSARIIPR
ncbi:MAG TPA: class I SAM-dependent methyltransferase [Candidatus Limnocylindrales bacterium]|nr:class I SAM-dependent methyltransferase [Candidatus Limnocylindrales bacterium]